MAQYSLTETEVVIPRGQELCGIQKVSNFDEPGSRVMLYHWYTGQEQETATREEIQVSLSAQPLRHKIVWKQETRNSPLMTVDSPRAKVPSYIVDVEYGTAPFEHSVVIQGSLSGKQVDSSIQ